MLSYCIYFIFRVCTTQFIAMNKEINFVYDISGIVSDYVLHFWPIAYVLYSIMVVLLKFMCFSLIAILVLNYVDIYHFLEF